MDEKAVDEKTPFNEAEEDLDSSKVKFVNGGAKADPSEASMPTVCVDVGYKEKKKDNDFCGLTKDELMQYADDPFWVKTRWVLLILFWIAWIGMLVAAILIIVLAPKCPPRPKLDWWQTSAIYQVYPRSFKDSNGDGIGDLKGVETKLDYLADLNIDAIWLNPIYPSMNLDFGYDITDYTNVNEEFGTMSDFKNLVNAAYKKGIKVILDFVPNHTSDKHKWFNASRQGADNEFSDYYVWHEGTNGSLPNNWVSVFGGPAWTFDPIRGAYYLHQFLPEQPDLNLRSAKVRQALQDVIIFWLDNGADGFRVDAASHLYEDESMRDEPASSGAGASGGYESLIHDRTKFQPESYQLVTEWRKLLDDYSDEEGRHHPRVLLVEATGPANKTMPFYKYEGEKGAHMPLNFNLMNINEGCQGQCISDLVSEWLDNVPRGKWSNWRTGNHDKSRVATRVNDRDLANAINMLALTLPGTSITYYGEELAMVDVDVSFDDTRDDRARRAGEANYREFTRDPQRTPMQWSAKPHAGFTDGDDTWLPVASDYREWNVKTQVAHGSGLSNIEVFKDLTVIRAEPSMQWGKFHEVLHEDGIYAYLRKAEGFDTFLVAINVGDDKTISLRHDASMVPAHGKIVASTKNFSPESRVSSFEKGTVVTLDNLKLRKGEGVIVSWDYAANE